VSAAPTKLLVSVRSAAEAEMALGAGADLIDIKEPSRGALGAADPEVWEEIRGVVDRRAPMSVALGELLAAPIEKLATQTGSAMFAKIGLARCQSATGWIARFGRVIGKLPRHVRPVPVAYADWPAADAPAPFMALTLAARCSSRMLLIDTFEKTRGGLLERLSWEALAELAELAKSAKIELALAGSLDADSIERLLPLWPAYIGVRGAVCRGGRSGTVDPALVKSLAELIHGAAKNDSRRCLT
jgi:(5-formylfuran-3-yl)methyl phosphate synthase